MRHRHSGRQLNRNSSHRKAMFKNMVASLVEHELIKTTLPKAKELRRFAEPLITLAKTDTVANRRLAFSRLRDKEAVGKLFSDLGPRYEARPGGYLRIMKCGYRTGDKAPMAYVELVDRPVVAQDVEVEVAPVAAPEPKAAAPKKANAKKDNLTKVEGIGPKIAETLNFNGIVTFADLAAAKPEEITEFIKDVRGNHVPDTWPKQAQLASEGKWDELREWQDKLDGGVEK